MSELPKGWVEAELGEVGHWQGGGTPSKANPEYWTNGTIPWVSPKDMKTPRISSAEDNITPQAIQDSSANLVPPGTILFVTRSGILKHSLPVAVSNREVAINQDLKALTPSDGLEPEFIARQARSKARFILRHCTKAGTTVDSVDFKKLQGVSISLPPLAEQKRIVAKLDALSARSARARDALARIDSLVKRYKQAVLSKAFSGELTELQADEIRNVVAVEEIVDELDQGWSPKCERVPATDEGQWAVITTTSIQSVEFDPQENKALPEGLEPRPHLRIEVGDILITRAGPRVRCGVCCFVAETRSNLMLCDKAYRLRLSDSYDPEFFVFLMNSPELLSEIEALKTGGNDSGLNLTQKRFKALRLPHWSIRTQKHCVGVIKKHFQMFERLAAEAKRALALTDTLEEAILAKAFRGELVPQDPDDEPASVLLERIRAERAATPRAKRGRRATA